MPKEQKHYRLWLEFEMWDFEYDEVDPERDFFNMTLSLPDGREYAFNVWTYGVFESLVEDARETGEYLNGLYMEPPDLFIQSMDRESCERAVEDMIEQGTLPHTCRYHDPGEWEDEVESDALPQPLQRPVALDEKRDYHLEWHARFRVKLESEIPRLVAWLARNMGCALDVLDASADEGAFDVRMRSVVADVTATEVFWRTNQYVQAMGAQHISGPDVDTHTWRFEVFNPNPRGVPYLEFLSAKCDYVRSTPHQAS